MNLAPFQGGRWGRFGYRFLGLDVDAKLASAAAAAEQAALLAAFEVECGISTVTALSGPSGGRHVWSRCDGLIPVDLVRRIAEAARVCCPALDIAPLTNAHTGALRPPGSHHRDGGGVQLLDHTVDEAVGVLSGGSAVGSFEELADLIEARAARIQRSGLVVVINARADHAAPTTSTGDMRLPQSVTSRGEPVRAVVTDETGHPCLRSPKRPVSAHTAALLATRLEADADHDHHAFGILEGLALAGFRRDEVASLARNLKQSPGLEWLRSTRTAHGRIPTDQKEFDRRLDRQWFLAVHGASRWPLAESGPVSRELTELTDDLTERMALAGRGRWTRPSGPADRAVLLAVVLLILVHHSDRISADVRNVGLMTGYSRQTVDTAIKRLIKDGWLRLIEPAAGARARVVTINQTAEHICPESEPGHECAVSNIGVDLLVLADRAGSDTIENARPPAYRDQDHPGLWGLLSTLAGDAWSAPKIGHHAAWTLVELQAHQGLATARELAQATGYRLRTTERHLEILTGLGLASWREGRVCRTTRSITQASAQTQAFGKGVGRAATYLVERHVAAWFQAELEYPSTPAESKIKFEPRAAPNDLVLPNCAATARAYPRTPDGFPDHATAWTIEARRLRHAALLAAAEEIERGGVPVDLLRLAHDGTVRPAIAPTRRTWARAA